MCFEEGVEEAIHQTSEVCLGTLLSHQGRHSEIVEECGPAGWLIFRGFWMMLEGGSELIESATLAGTLIAPCRDGNPIRIPLEQLGLPRGSVLDS